MITVKEIYLNSVYKNYYFDLEIGQNVYEIDNLDCLENIENFYNWDCLIEIGHLVTNDKLDRYINDRIIDLHIDMSNESSILTFDNYTKSLLKYNNDNCLIIDMTDTCNNTVITYIISGISETDFINWLKEKRQKHWKKTEPLYYPN